MKPIDFPIAYSNIYPLLLLFLTLFLGSTEALAKSPVSNTEQKNKTFEINNDTLKAKIEAINAREGIDETTKSKVLSIYQSAEDNLNNSEKFKARTVTLIKVKQAPEKTKKLQKEIEQTLLKVSRQKLEDFSRILEELEQRLIIEKGKISSLDEQLKKLENELVSKKAAHN